MLMVRLLAQWKAIVRCFEKNQALVNPTSFGYAKRAASGFDPNRLTLLIAVLERRTKLNLSDKDIFINVVGGLKTHDRAADFHGFVVMAIASAGCRA